MARTTTTPEERATMAATGVSRQLFSLRIAGGWERAKALTTPPGTGPRKGGRKSTFTPEERAQMKAAGVGPSAVFRRLHLGWDRARALTTSRAQETAGAVAARKEQAKAERAKARARGGGGGSPNTSRRGSAFTTAELETMRAAGVIRQTFAARIRAGWERAAALSTPPHKMAHPQKHGRYTIPSDIVAAAAARGIQENTLRLRVAMGWPLERAATEPPGATERYLLGGKTAVEVAKEHGVNPDAFYARLGLGWTIERAATEPVRQQVKRTKVPKGAQPTHFVGERPAFEVAEENGISRQLFWARMKTGWTALRAATEPAQGKHTVGDRPALEVAEEHGITSAAFYSRIKYGWTAERAATEPMRRRGAAKAAPATPRGG